MKNKVFAVFAASLLLLNVAGFSLAAQRNKRPVSKRPAKVKQANQLVALLPASDAIVAIDSKRFVNNALPKLLSANQPLLSQITAKLDEVQQKTGIDLRQFEQVAAGFTMKQGTGKDVDFDPVVIARGDINAGALVALAKVASNGKYREEKIGERTVYVFSPKDLAKQHATVTGNQKVAGAIDRTIDGLVDEIAIASIDANTMALGSLSRVRQTLQTKTHVGLELTSLLSKKPTAIASFAAKTPAGMSKLLPLDNDELGATVDSIRFVSGSMDMTEGNAVLQMMARTVKPEQAQSLLETLQGLQMVGKAFLGGAKGADKQVYARLIDSVKF
ncbi:MAG: hypothetical protein ABI999_16560, partial [Acidobacteriota bacterium]